METMGIANRSGDVGDEISVIPENNKAETFIATVVRDGVVLVSRR